MNSHEMLMKTSMFMNTKILRPLAGPLLILALLGLSAFTALAA